MTSPAQFPFVELHPEQIGIFGKELDAATAEEQIVAAADAGLSGCFLNSPSVASPRLDPGALRHVAAVAAERGIRLSAALGSLNPLRPARSAEALAFGDGDLLAGFVRMLEACATLGVRAPMVVVGIEADRFDPVIPWVVHLAAARAFFAHASRIATDLGLHLLVKTHQELTSWEALEIVDAAGSEHLGVAIDPVNLLVRMEDPLAAATRLAGVIGQVHVDDTQLVRDASGLHRQLVPVGDGDVAWAHLVERITRSDPAANWWGEVHQAELHMPFQDDGWFGHHPHIGTAEVAAWVALGSRRQRAEGSLIGDIAARRARVVAALGQRVTQR